MYYQVTHKTHFSYDEPILESVMETRKQPRTDATQRCLSFQLDVQPRANPSFHQDHLGNIVHSFDVPGRHSHLTINSEAVVEVYVSPELPVVGPEGWSELDQAKKRPEFFDMLQFSRYTHPSVLLDDLKRELDVVRRDDPLSLLCEINALIYDAFSYLPNTTRVDSHIDEALKNRAGVCQDFAHIMIAILRGVGIPCRYVSGYLYHFKDNDHDRSVPDASHAWIEAWLPQTGWIGLDPTNNLICEDRHIRVAIGRDYGDVPPTRGTFKGNASSELTVEVSVCKLDSLPDLSQIQPPAFNWDEAYAQHDRVQQQMQMQQ